MVLSLDDIVKRDQPLYTEIINSIPEEAMANFNGYLDVKIVINGIEVEPVVYNYLIQNINGWVSDKAKHLMIEKYEDINTKTSNLMEMIDTVTKTVKDDFVSELNYYF